MTLTEARADGAARLRAAGIAGGARDADRILAAVLNIAPGRLRMVDDRALTDAEAERFLDGIAARAAHQPVAQIVGFRDFYAHRFRVTRDTLDPRPETEALVDAALSLPFSRVLDMGTGTGAILISVLAARVGASGVGSDISAAALDVARQNAQMIGVTADFVLADWYDGITGRFDLILSNPPYIAAEEMPGLSRDVREWEPISALTDRADGLTAYGAIAAGARRHLTPGGHVAVEIGPTQASAVAAMFVEQGAETRVVRDLDGRDRVVVAQFPA